MRFAWTDDQAAFLNANLRPDEAFLSVYFGRYGSFVWAVPKQGPVGFKFVQTNLNAMNGKVRQLRRALEPQAESVADIPPFDLKLAYELYDLLLKPVEAGWKSAKSIIVVANGDLGLLPLSLLLFAAITVECGLSRIAVAAVALLAGIPMFVQGWRVIVEGSRLF